MDVIFEDVKIKGYTYLSARRGDEFYIATKRYDPNIHILLLQAEKISVRDGILTVAVTPENFITFNRVGAKL